MNPILAAIKLGGAEVILILVFLAIVLAAFVLIGAIAFHLWTRAKKKNTTQPVSTSTSIQRQ